MVGASTPSPRSANYDSFSAAGAVLHGALRRSTPAKEATLRRVPRELRLTFTEPVERAVARLTLVHSDGQPVTLGSVVIPPDSATQLVAEIQGAMTAGRYTVQWQVAGADGHPVRGDFTFDVAPGADGALAPGASVNADSATRPSSEHPAVDTASEGATAAATPHASMAHHDVLRLVAQTVAMHGVADGLQAAAMRPMITGTTWGVGWLLLVAAGVLGLIGYLGARQHESWGWRTAAVAGALAALALALSGHAVAVPRWQGVAVTADVLHMMGAGGWLGSLSVLLIAGVPAARRLGSGLRDAAVAALVRAFSPTALIAAALVSGTGLIAAWLHVGTPSALWTSGYGRLLLLKVGVVALVAITGAYNWRRVLPALGHDTGTIRVQRSARAEVAIAVLVLIITAILVATSPPTPMGS